MSSEASAGSASGGLPVQSSLRPSSGSFVCILRRRDRRRCERDRAGTSRRALSCLLLGRNGWLSLLQVESSHGRFGIRQVLVSRRSGRIVRSGMMPHCMSAYSGVERVYAHWQIPNR